MMFYPGSSVRVYVAPGVTDMRKSINGLSIQVEEHLGLDPLSGHLFAFCNRKRDIVKVLYWDANGFCLWHKRLEKERFAWPQSNREALALTGRELRWLLEGLSLERSWGHRRLVYESVL